MSFIDNPERKRRNWLFLGGMLIALCIGVYAGYTQGMFQPPVSQSAPK